MRRALNANPDRPQTPVQRMFEQLVDGTSSALPESRDDLAGLVTAVEWVEDILDGLPEATAVRSALAKADLLDPMRRLASAGVFGRKHELKRLGEYVLGAPGPQSPLFVFGPGGMGKSTLLARFILK